MAGPIAFPFVEGSKLFATKEMTGATSNLYCGLHEVEEMAFILQVLAENDLFVDIGANIGSYTILAAAGPKAKVISIEPIPSTFFKLSLNIKLNDFDEFVSAYNVGLSDKNGVLKFFSNLDTINHVIADDEKIPNIEVKVLTLDEVIANRCTTVIQIDVEDHEIHLLRGGSTTLNNFNLLAVVMETNGSGTRFCHTDQDLIDTMAS